MNPYRVINTLHSIAQNIYLKPIAHFLELGHRTMVCAVYITIFLEIWSYVQENI